VHADTGCAVVFDGRLDNRAELGASLRASAGSADDAEVVADAYVRWGERTPDRLVGDYAFAVWDPRARALFVARDPIGARPMFWAHHDGRVVFASTVAQVLACVPRDVDETTFLWYLYGAYPPPRQRTFHEHVHWLPGGHALVVRDGRPRVTRFWHWPEEPPETRLDAAAAVDEFRALFEQAVDARLAEDHRTGIFVSGGLDSSSVAVMAGDLARRTEDRDIQLYSMVFDELPSDERQYSGAVAKRAGLPHHLLPADECWTLANLESWLPMFTEPAIGASVAALHMMMARARDDGVRTVLWGHGADHLLTGSPRSMAALLVAGRLRAVHDQVKSQVETRGGPYARRLLASAVLPLVPTAGQRLLMGRVALPPRAWIAEEMRARFGGDGTPPIYAGADSWWYQLRDGLAGYGQVPLSGYETMLRSFGLDYAGPFLDLRLVDLVLRVPGDLLYRDGRTKVLLRRAMHDLLPPLVRDRTDKANFTPLVERGLRERRRGLVTTLLDDSELERRGYILSEPWKRMVHRYLDGDNALATQCWITLTAELWLRAQEGRVPAG
jgi:asparagine synthase (glutamine-hydrolysing)